MKHRLEFDSIQFSFGERRLLSSVYLAVETGTIAGLLGRNGSGKSTLMQIVFGSIPHEQKSVRIDGASIGLAYLKRRAICYLPQSDLIPLYLSMRNAFSLFGISEEVVVSAFPETASMMELKPAELSDGYLRIFEILMILNTNALFCFLDEPFSGLSPVYIEKVKTLLLEAKAKKGIIITDHLHKHVLDVADGLYVLANGEIYHVKEPHQLISLGYVNHL